MSLHPLRLLRAAVPFLLFAAVAGPVSAGAAPPLGLECAAEQGWGARSAAADGVLDKAKAAGDWKAAVAPARVMAGEQCDNAYLWINLAIFYARAGQAREALELGAYVFGKFPNQVEGSLQGQEGESFKELKALPGFQESALGRQLAARYAEREDRSKKAREAVAAAPAAERPPEHYVAKDACPFECCAFREWSVEAPIELYKAPAGAKTGRKLMPGDQVVGLTGEVHLRPRPLLVGHPFEGEKELGSPETIPVPAGAVVYELDSLGEGFVRFWYKGRKFEKPLAIHCLVFDADCWSDYIDPAGTPVKHDWWVKVKLADGSKAWALSEGFGNMDACG
jgi:hypothetical protein